MKKMYFTEPVERDRLVLYFTGIYRRIPYSVVNKIYGTKQYQYLRMAELKKEGYIVVKNRRWVELGETGRIYVKHQFNVNYDEIRNEERERRWEKVSEIAFRDALIGRLIPSWCIKSNSKGVEPRNQAVGVVEGVQGRIAVFVVRKSTTYKTLKDMMHDIDEMATVGYPVAMVLCEDKKTTEAVMLTMHEKTIKLAEKVILLPKTETGLKIAEVILLIEDWKERVVQAVYRGNWRKDTTLQYADIVLQGRRGIEKVWVGIDCDEARRMSLFAHKQISKDVTGYVDRILCLEGQEERFEGLDVPVDTIDVDTFLDLFKADIEAKSDVKEWFKCLPK